MSSVQAPTRIGIVGGYGGVGEIVARELARDGAGELVIGGRNLGSATRLCEQLGGGATARRVDVFDHASLVDFCRPCQLVINCAAPTARVLDRVARAALECGSHYVDPGGTTIVQTLAERKEEIRQRGLVYVTTAGWVPGVTELLAAAAVGELDAVDDLAVYVQDQSPWSESSCEDLIREMHDRPVGDYTDGVWRAQGLRFPERRRFPAPFGAQWILPRRWHELEGIIARSGARHAGLYMRGDLLSQLFLGATRLLFRDRERLAAPVMRRVLMLEHRLRGGAGLVQAVARGSRHGSPRTVTAQISFVGDRHYVVTGIPCVLTVRLLFAGQLAPGLTALGDAVDARSFLASLAEAGIPHEISGSDELGAGGALRSRAA